MSGIIVFDLKNKSTAALKIDNAAIRKQLNSPAVRGLLMHPMLNIGVRAARAGGNIITRYMNRLDTIKIDQKQRNDFVSEVDRASEAEIIDVLQKAFPSHAILGEESGLTGDADAEYQWVVDPLDGTTNFLHGFPHINVSIALKHNGKTTQGIIYDPVSQELFTATRGEGASLNNKRLRVSKVTKMAGALVGYGFPNREGDDLDTHIRIVREMMDSVTGTRRMGACALDMAYVAAGRLDGYWISGFSEWDVAAGALIVREAGGLVNDYNAGGDFVESSTLVCGNPKITHGMLQIIKPAAGQLVTG